MFNINAFQNHLTQREPTVGFVRDHSRAGTVGQVEGLTPSHPNKISAYLTQDGELRCYSPHHNESKTFSPGIEDYAAIWVLAHTRKENF